mmetsp:Transcript_34671/g.98234  ORF Transcript_34671/g.98234 Transcript_34671/m.98234 type:complete len:368 (-) Transcript_34671:192-1295(-)
MWCYIPACLGLLYQQQNERAIMLSEATTYVDQGLPDAMANENVRYRDESGSGSSHGRANTEPRSHHTELASYQQQVVIKDVPDHSHDHTAGMRGSVEAHPAGQYWAGSVRRTRFSDPQQRPLPGGSPLSGSRHGKQKTFMVEGGGLAVRPVSGTVAEMASAGPLSLVTRMQQPRAQSGQPLSRAPASTAMPGSAWVPPEHYRSWFQGSKALAKMPEVKPPPPPTRHDKRDFAGARFYGASRNLYLPWNSSGSATVATSSISIPTMTLGPDWQQSSDKAAGSPAMQLSTKHVQATGKASNDIMKTTMSYEAAELLDAGSSSTGNWDSWMSQQQQHQKSPRVAVSAREKRILKAPPNHPRPRTAASNLL